jgi:hypothetical protein
VCRNSYCTASLTCLCGTGEDDTLNPVGSGRTIVLTVSPFSDNAGRTGSRISVRGTTEPGAKVVVSVLPDGVNSEVLADASGKWQIRLNKALTAGEKTLVVTATKDDGVGRVKQPFTVVATSGGIGLGWIVVILVIAALAFGGYVYYKSL